MVVVLKQSGTILRLRERLKMEVRTSASLLAHALGAQPSMLSGPAALQGLFFLRVLCTWCDGIGGSQCVCCLSVFFYRDTIIPLTPFTNISYWECKQRANECLVRLPTRHLIFLQSVNNLVNLTSTISNFVKATSPWRNATPVWINVGKLH